MPQIGSESSPIMIKGNRKGKKLGMVGKFSKTKSIKNYQDNYDRIFRKNQQKEDMITTQRRLTELNWDGE